MLIKVTNYCSMGCSHCMEDSTVAGAHMTEETFIQALEFTKGSECLAYAFGCPPMVGLTGGECSENPALPRFIELARRAGFNVTLITNGMWLSDKELRESLLRPEWSDMQIQVTNDSRFYPKAPPRHHDSRIVYVDALQHLVPLGRAGRRNLTTLRTARAPTSFNLRSLTRNFGSYMRAVAELRRRFMQGKGGFCTPTILEDGRVTAGETRNCYIIGTIHSSEQELTKVLCEMECNKCGLETNLTPEQRAAIGAREHEEGHHGV